MDASPWVDAGQTQLAEGWLCARPQAGWGCRDVPGPVLPSPFSFTCIPAPAPSPDLPLGPHLYGDRGWRRTAGLQDRGADVTEPLLGAWPSARGFMSVKETDLCPSTPVGKNRTFSVFCTFRSDSSLLGWRNLSLGIFCIFPTTCPGCQRLTWHCGSWGSP